MAIVNHTMSFRRAKRCSTSLLALMMAAGLGAGASAADQGSAEGASVEEVVITAQHRAQKDKDVAETVSPISAANLDEFSAGGADITFLDARVPGLYASSSYGRTYPVFSIRGFSNNDFDYNAQQPVSVYYDNVVLLNPILKSFPVFDTQGVEVAKGPQGTLYGTDTPGGIIKIDSQRPTDKFEGYGDIAYSTYNSVDVNGAVNVPLVPDKLVARLSLLDERRDNWVINDFALNTRAPKVNGYDDQAGRFQLLWTPDADTSVLLNLHGRNLSGTSTLFRAKILQPGTNDLVPGFKINHQAFDDLYTQKEQQRGANLDIEHDFGLVKLTSISGWEKAFLFSRGDLDGGYINRLTGATNVPEPPTANPYTVPPQASADYGKLEQFTQEVRLSNDPNSRLFNQGGAYFFHDLLSNPILGYNDATDSSGHVLDNPLGYFVNFRQSAISWGIFDSASYKITDQWVVQAGIRQSHDYKNFNSATYYVIGAPYTYNDKGGVGSSLVSWDFSTNYAINDNVSAYFRAARGGKGAAIESREAFTSTSSYAKQEVTTSYEGGFKTDFLNKTVKFNIAGYVWNDRDGQITSSGGVLNNIVLQNVANIEGYGFEFEGSWRPVPNLVLTGGGAYNHTEIQDPNAYYSTCGNGCTPTRPVNAAGLESINGTPMQNAPLWTANWTARYTIPISGGSAGLFAFTDWTFRSSVLTTGYEAVESNVKPFLLGGLRIGYENYDYDFEASVFVRNIANTIQNQSATINFVPNDQVGIVNDPRIIGVQLRKRF